MRPPRHTTRCGCYSTGKRRKEETRKTRCGPVLGLVFREEDAGGRVPGRQPGQAGGAEDVAPVDEEMQGASVAVEQEAEVLALGMLQRADLRRVERSGNRNGRCVPHSRLVWFLSAVNEIIMCLENVVILLSIELTRLSCNSSPFALSPKNPGR